MPKQYFDSKILRKSKVETLEDYRRFTSCSFISISHTQWITRVPGLSVKSRSATFSLFAKQHDHDPGLIHHRHPAHTHTDISTSKSFWLHYCDSSSPVDQQSSGHLSCCGVHRQPLGRDLALCNNWFIIQSDHSQRDRPCRPSAHFSTLKEEVRHKYSTSLEGTGNSQIASLSQI